MTNSTIRELKLANIRIPIKVSHAHFVRKPEKRNTANMLDVFDIELFIQYEHQPISKNPSLEGILNFQTFFEKIYPNEIQELSGPIEGMLDKIVEHVRSECLNQQIGLLFCKATIRRKNNFNGEAKFEKLWGTLQSYKGVADNLRSVGLNNIPFRQEVAHYWDYSTSSLIEKKSKRDETFLLSFNVQFRSKDLSRIRLDGLFDATEFMEEIEHLQKITLEFPVEGLLDQINKMLEAKARQLGLQLAQTEVLVQRTDFPRIDPTFAVRTFFAI